MRQKVIIAGAGISAAPPSNLPSWWEYNKKLIVQIKAEVLKLCPEAADLLECIDVENKLPVQSISQIIVSQGAGESYFPLLELLNGTLPNANHFALSELARLGQLKAVISTNFDTLIEAAFQSEAVPLYTTVQSNEYYEAVHIPACKLFKIHGSVHDIASLIDTVSQKAVGLSAEKRLILENIFCDSEIFVIGFSGADLDFDLNYIPLAKALEGGSSLTWVIRPGSPLNPNVEELKRRYPQNVCVREMELRELFETFGVQYRELTLTGTTVTENDEKLTQRIAELFSSVHIGAHGCVGYCLTMLDMIGAGEAAEKLAEIYEKKLDWSELDVLSVTGVNALARQKLLSRDWQGAIRGYKAVIQCHKRLNALNIELQETADVIVSPEQNREREREYAQNLTAAYLNLGNVYYHMAKTEGADTLDEAKKFLELAQSQLQKEPDIPYHSMVSFVLARIEYLQDLNYDKYINALRVSSEFAKEEGRLDTLAEILLEECKIRMRIGEYNLAKKALDLSRNVLKNVGRIALKQSFEKLYSEYGLRTGEHAEQLTDELLKSWISRVNERDRKLIILIEANRETKLLAPLFYNLCVKYIEKEDWQRLRDVAQCCYAAACTDSQKSDALYALGCAAIQLTIYRDAEKYFGQIVGMGEGVNDLKLGWAHSELARILINRGDISPAMRHFDECIKVLLNFGDMKELTSAAANIVVALFRNGQTEQAESAAAQLLEVIDGANAADFQRYLEYCRRTYNRNTYDDILNRPPKVIATQALSLYDAGDTKQAWELMRHAEKKYKEAGNEDGVGRCENNMGTWCLSEGNNDQAIVHLKAAMDIKFSLGDVGGGISQLANLLQIYTELLKDFEKAAELAAYAEQNMPLFADKEERYMLYYCLVFYKLRTGKFASALEYCKMAEEGLPYLLKEKPECGEILRTIINMLENTFACQTTFAELSEFERQAQEAARLGKIGELDKCLAMATQLKATCGEDKLKRGVLDGTCGNALLEAGKDALAIEYFRSAIENFDAVTGDDIETAANHRLTAVNGIALALGHLGREDEAITLYRAELKRTEITWTDRCSLTVNLCNRLILLYKDTLRKDDGVFTEVCNLLDSLVAPGSLGHEELGGVYCAYGLLYSVIDDNASAKRYYLQAKKEFLIVNSPKLTKIEQALKQLV